MDILLIGGAGFIGRNIIESLPKEKYNITVLSKYLEPDRVSLKRFEEITLTDKFDAKYDCVIDLARSGFLNSLAHTFKMLNKCKKYKCGKYIFPSSAATYLPPVKNPCVETQHRLPRTKYGLSKSLGESLCRRFASQNLETVSLILFNVYGNYDKGSTIRKMIQTCLAGEDLIVYKDVIRDYVHASDVAEAFRKASEVNNLPPCLNIGSGETASNEFLAEYIIKKTKSNSKIILKENRKIVKECWADISLAKKVLKHTPKKGIEQGINEAIQETKDEYQR